MQNTRAKQMVLADYFNPALFKSSAVNTAVREAILIGGGALFVSLLAQIAIRLPWTTVPITGQTFGVLVVGGALGAWRGASALTLYMLMGLVGISIYAPTNPGITDSWGMHFILPWKGSSEPIWDISSGGYIVGFIFAAFVTGWFAQKSWDRGPWGILAMLAGNAVLYIPGLLWLYYLISTGWIHPVGRPLADLITGTGDWDKTLKGGLYPFIIGDLMKLYLAALTLPAAWKLVNWIKNKKGSNP